MTPTKTTKDDNSINNTGGFDKISFILILLTGFLVPIFFLPIFNIATDISKGILIYTFTAVAFFLWLISRLKDGRFIFPKSIILMTGALIPITALISSIFSGAPEVSFVGLGYEMGTFASLLVLFILMFLASIFFQKIERVSVLYFTILFSALIVFIYQITRFVFVDFGLPFADIFTRLPGNLIGKWADMAIFFGLTAIISLVTIELISLSRKIKLLLYTIFAISILVLVIVNMKLVWIIVGFFSLIIFVYTISFGKGRISKNGERKIPAIPFALLLFSLFFILAGGIVGDFIYSSTSIPQEVLRPAWGQTFDVAKDSLIESPILGDGPNRFKNIWLLFKPAEVNKSLLWNVDFDTGVGLIPSFMITSGVAGILAWLAFLLAFLYIGVRSVFSSRVSSVNHYIVVSSFIASLYLWLFSFFYVPNATIIFLAFLITGVFVAAISKAKIIKNYDFSFLEDPRVGFVSVLVLILLVISSIAGGYLLFQKFLSVGYFQKSIIAFNVEGNLDKAEKNIILAIKLNKSDLYYRTFAEMNLARIRVILAQKNISKETIRTNFTNVSRAAIQDAIKATEIDSSNYLNWITLAKVYGTLMQLGGEKGFYESAGQAYEKAFALNPSSPAILLDQARLEILAGNKKLAKGYVAKALNKKNNYTEAIFLLSKIQADEGNLGDAITSVEVASLVSPNDIGVFFQLGLLRYKNSEYKGAIAAFERAVELNPNYSNAKYFLGLSYYKEGYKSKAKKQFEQISALNPGNKVILKILKNIKNGNSPLSNTKSVDNLPIDEQ